MQPGMWTNVKFHTNVGFILIHAVILLSHKEKGEKEKKIPDRF